MRECGKNRFDFMRICGGNRSDLMGDCDGSRLGLMNKYSRSRCGLVNIIQTGRVSLLFMVCCMALTGCGRSDVVTDYGYQQENGRDNARTDAGIDGKVQDVAGADTGTSTKTSEGADGENGYIASDKERVGSGEGKDEEISNGRNNLEISANETVREMLGADRVEWSEEFEVEGVPVELSMKYTIPDLPFLAAFTGRRVTDTEVTKNLSGTNSESVKNVPEDNSEEGALKDKAANSAEMGSVNNLPMDRVESEVVNNLLGDSAEPVEELESDMEDGEWYELWNNYWSILNQFDPFNKSSVQIGWMEEDTMRLLRMDTDDFYIHLYQGLYDGIPVRLIYAYSFAQQKQCIAFAPIYLADYFRDGKEYEDGSRYEDLIGTETMQEKMMEGKTNRCELSDEELVEEAADFLKDMLSIPVYDDMISLNANDVYIGNYGDGKTQMLFTTHNYWFTESSDEVLCDGYEAYISGKLSGLFPARGKAGYMLNNSGSVVITSKGVLSAFLVRQMDITNVTEHIRLLDAERIKDSFLDVMQEKFDYSKLEFAGKKLYFNELAMTYYPVTDPKDENAFTYIPVWEFTATMQSRRYVVVYINAIDGSLTDVVY